jgi:hypothetical protein
MHHDVFGDITYSPDDLAWSGWCTLPVFAEYGRLAPDDYRLSEPPPGFDRGVFAITVQDSAGDGPSVEQANAFRFLLERETEVCGAVMTELVRACGMRGGLLRWLNERRDSRVWGGLARLFGPEYKMPENLKPAVRCLRLEVSSQCVGGYSYVGLFFETIFGTETAGGLSVIFHPQEGTFWGDASAIDTL